MKTARDDIRRRDLITLLSGAAAAWPLAAHSQPAGTRKVGFVLGSTISAGAAYLSAFREGLAAAGWVDGRNVEIVAHFGADNPQDIHAYAEELVRMAPDAIVVGNSAMAAELMTQTTTIPIVLTNVTDPIALGLVKSLARPGGNVTGFTNFEAATAAKWLGLLLEIAPEVTRVLVLLDAPQLSAAVFARAIDDAGSALRLPITKASIREDTDIEQAIEAFAAAPGGGLIVAPGPVFANKRALILRLAARYHLPDVFAVLADVVAGGLIAYAPDVPDLFRRTASYVDRILKGSKPGDLPIQNPTKYELAINLKTAKALGLTVPPTLLALADDVIE